MLVIFLQKSYSYLFLRRDRMTWFSFFLFTLLHVFANLKAVKAVSMETLNRTRYMIILKHFASTNDVPSVKIINRLEPVVMGLIPTGKISDVIQLTSSYASSLSLTTEKEVCGFRIELGSSIKAIASRQELENQLANYSERNFALIPDSVTKTIYVIYRRDCTAEEMLESYSLAVLAAMLASGYSVSQTSFQ